MDRPLEAFSTELKKVNTKIEQLSTDELKTLYEEVLKKEQYYNIIYPDLAGYQRIMDAKAKIEKRLNISSK